MLVGNKCDLDDERVVKSKRGEDLAAEFAVEFMETSAKVKHTDNYRLTILLLLFFHRPTTTLMQYSRP